MKVLVLFALALALPDIALRHLFPRWLGRLAFRSMAPTRRFVLPGGPRAPAGAAGYRDDALPRSNARLPVLPDRLEVAPGAVLVRDGRTAFTLVRERDRATRTAGFVVRIAARDERGEIVLRARQAPPFVVLPWILPWVSIWLVRRNPPGAAIGIVIATVIAFLVMLVPWLLDTLHRDRVTRLAMETIEREARAASPGETEHGETAHGETAHGADDRA